MKAKAIILAAGKGTRMKSDLPKGLHHVAGMTMVEWAHRAAKHVDKKPVIITNKDVEQMRDVLKDSADYAIQHEQKGTGHAVMMAKDFFPEEGYIAVLLGDMALLRGESIKNLVKQTIDNGWHGAVLTAVTDDPFGYGRIIRDSDGNVRAIVEQRDCTDEQKEIKEFNTGVMCFEVNTLNETLKKIGNNNSQGEYYLTDAIKILVDEGKKIGSVQCDFYESLGVNDKVQLAQVSKIMQTRINEDLMREGVNIIDPATTYISGKCTVAPNATIYPNNYLEGECTVGAGSILYPNNHITDSHIGENTMVRSSTLINAKVGNNTTIGPNAYLRPETVVGDNCRVGDFVEIKKSTIGNGTKISHLTYVGDAKLGENINIGCGVVFSNYDGKKKHLTIVEDNAFIGCNTNLVPPVTVGEGSYIAAGSTITKDVPKDALAVARAKQTNIEDWAKKKREQGDL